MRVRALQRGGAIASLLLIGSLFLGPIVASADSFWSGILIDSQRRLAVNCEVGCQNSTPWAQSNPGYIRITDKANANAVSVDAGWQGGSIDNRNFVATESLIYGQDGSVSVHPLKMASGTGTLMVTDGGQNLTKLTATACSQIGSATLLYRIWSAGAETATLSVYTNSTCTNLLWSGIPASTPITLGVDNNASNFWYKFGAAPAVNDYVTTN